MKTMVDDLRYAVRGLRKHPTFAILAIATLALAIGANTAMFSVARAVLLDPLPYPDSSRLVMIWEDASTMGFPENTPAPGNYADWKSQSTAFRGMAATRKRTYSLTGVGQPDRLNAHQVTYDIFSVLGMNPEFGRPLTSEDDRPGAPNVAVISASLWRSRFDGTGDTIGRSVLLDGTPYTIVGIMPDGFDFPESGTQIWTPLALSAEQLQNRGNHFLWVVARLKPGVTVAKAQTDMDVIARRLAQDYPEANAGIGIRVKALREQLVGSTADALMLLMAVVACVLLIACGNLANLMLARGVSRQKEIGVRIALGASRSTLLRQLFMESLVLSAAGTLISLFVAVWGIQFLSVLTPAGMSSARPVLDATVLMFTFALGVSTSIIFGAVPTRHAWKLGITAALKQGGSRSGEQRSTHRLRSWLIVSQTAFTFALLVAGGLMLRTFSELRSIDPGFRGENVLTMRTALPVPRYRGLEARSAFYSKTLERVYALPGVVDAGYTSWLPYRNWGGSSGFVIEGRPTSPNQQFDANLRLITPGYLSAMGMNLVKGRLLAAADRAGAEPVMVINQTMANKFWPGQEPLESRVHACSECSWFRVVGVVADVHQKSLETEVRPEYFVPYDQLPQQLSWAAPQDLAVRVTADPTSMTTALREAIWAVDSQQPVTQVKVLADYLDEDLAPRRFQTQLAGGFAAVGLLLASLGIYGVVSYAVSQRQREIGVRIALGAQSREVARWVTGQGMRPTVIGLGIGIGASYALARLISRLLYGVQPRDPLTFGLAAVALLVIALLACWIPARRASRVDPVRVLHYE